MTKIVGEVAVTVGADVSKFDQGMKRAARSTKTFDKNFAAMGRKVANVGLGIAAAAAGIGIASAKMASAAFSASAEINNLSRVAGIGAERFQRLAAASDTVGISQEKLSDIFKDVNDKFGDFMATGAGPLADFFENIAPAVGVTAEQFAKLSGPDALIAYVDALEKAGVSQQQMTFYMEAIASDATGLLPLLRDNGAEFRRLGDAAERAGRVMSNEAVEGGAALDAKFREIGDTLRQTLNAAIVENSDKIIDLAYDIEQIWIPALTNVLGKIGSVALKVAEMAGKIADATSGVREFVNVSTLLNPGGAAADAIRGWLEPDTETEAMRKARTKATRYPTLDGVRAPSGPEAGDPRGDQFGVHSTPPVIPPLRLDVPPGNGTGDGDGDGGGGGGLLDLGGGGAGPTREDVEAMQERFAEQREAIQMQYEQDLEQLREYREARLGTEEEFNDLEAEIKADHAEKLADLEARAQRERLQQVSGALGDLGSLMQSENDKLFKIGKAAKVAQAVMDGYAAATSAWEKGMKIGGPPLAAAFTAASLAKTGALISSLQSTTASGGSTGSASAGGAAATTTQTAEAPQAQQVNIAIGSGEFFPRSALVSLAEELQSLSRDGAIVTVN